MSSVAVRGSSGTVGSGSSGPPRPFSPWIHSAVSSGRASGPAAPAATGTSVTPATESAMRALRLVCSSGTLPPTVVTARTSSDGCPAASHRAKTSSCPGSQSMITGMVMRARSSGRRRPVGGRVPAAVASTAARGRRRSRPCLAPARRARRRRPRCARASGERTPLGEERRERTREPVTGARRVDRVDARRGSRPRARRVGGDGTGRAERHDDRAGDAADSGCREHRARSSRIAPAGASVPMPTARASCSFSTSGSAERRASPRRPPPAARGSARSGCRAPRRPRRHARWSATGSSPCVSTTVAAATRSRSASTTAGRQGEVRTAGDDDGVLARVGDRDLGDAGRGIRDPRRRAPVGSPNRSSVASAKSPAASSPTRATNSTEAPTTCAATAWFDPLPPSATWKPCARIVSPGSGNAAT